MGQAITSVGRSPMDDYKALMALTLLSRRTPVDYDVPRRCLTAPTCTYVGRGGAARSDLS
jgi:hypothetical protein